MKTQLNHFLKQRAAQTGGLKRNARCVVARYAPRSSWTYESRRDSRASDPIVGCVLAISGYPRRIRLRYHSIFLLPFLERFGSTLEHPEGPVTNIRILYRPCRVGNLRILAVGHYDLLRITIHDHVSVV